MTIQEYKQQLYDACREHIFLAQQALDRYETAKTDQERRQARIDNIQHLVASNALQWALDKAIDFRQEIKQAQIDVLNKLRRIAWQGYQIGMYIVSTQEIDELIKEIENAEDKG